MKSSAVSLYGKIDQQTIDPFGVFGFCCVNPAVTYMYKTNILIDISSQPMHSLANSVGIK